MAGAGGVLPAVFGVCVHGVSAVRPVRRRQTGAGVMLQHITRPAVVSLGTCSSVAAIPTNPGGGGEDRHQPGCGGDGDSWAPRCTWTAPAQPVLKVAFRMGVLGQDMGWESWCRWCWWRCCRRWGMSGVPAGGYIGEYIICSIFFPTQMELVSPFCGHRQPGGPSCHHDQLLRGLCGFVHRLRFVDGKTGWKRCWQGDKNKGGQQRPPLASSEGISSSVCPKSSCLKLSEHTKIKFQNEVSILPAFSVLIYRGRIARPTAYVADDFCG